VAARSGSLCIPSHRYIYVAAKSTAMIVLFPLTPEPRDTMHEYADDAEHAPFLARACVQLMSALAWVRGRVGKGSEARLTCSTRGSAVATGGRDFTAFWTVRMPVLCWFFCSEFRLGDGWESLVSLISPRPPDRSKRTDKPIKKESVSHVIYQNIRCASRTPSKVIASLVLVEYGPCVTISVSRTVL